MLNKSHLDKDQFGGHTLGDFELVARKGVAGGYCELDAGALIPDARIPSAIARDTELQWTLDLSSYIVPSASHPVVPITRLVEELGQVGREWGKLWVKDISAGGIGDSPGDLSFYTIAGVGSGVDGGDMNFRTGGTFGGEAGCFNFYGGNADSMATAGDFNVYGGTGTDGGDGGHINLLAGDGAGSHTVGGHVEIIAGLGEDLWGSQGYILLKTKDAILTPGGDIFITAGVSAGLGYFKNNGSIIFNTNNGVTMRVDGTGNVGIGTEVFGDNLLRGLCMGLGVAPTTLPADIFQVWSAYRAGIVGKTGLHLATENGTPYVFSDRAGMGTLTPSEKLEVVGRIKAEEFIGTVTIDYKDIPKRTIGASAPINPVIADIWVDYN